MALLLLSDRQRAELEELVSHTPFAKERCRAQALLWIAEGSDVGEVAELLHVSRQTIYNWRSRFQERAELDLRAGLLDAPRLAAHGRLAAPSMTWSPPSSTATQGSLAITPPSGPPHS